MNSAEDKDDWQIAWDARRAALELEFGNSDDDVAHSPLPIYLGGGADVLIFKHHLAGIAYVTADLIGDGSQIKTSLGEYELMMCVREEQDWAPSFLSGLAPYTFEVPLNSGETMDIAPAMPAGSTIAALLFNDYHQFKVSGHDAGVLLCIGITSSELEYLRDQGFESLLAKLKESNVYPFTDVERKSVI